MTLARGHQDMILNYLMIPESEVRKMESYLIFSNLCETVGEKPSKAFIGFAIISFQLRCGLHVN